MQPSGIQRPYTCIGAWKQIVAYHDLCDHDDIPAYVESGFHDHEAACEDYFCNAVPAGYDGAVCPSPPAPPPTADKDDDDDLNTGAIVGIAVAAATAALAIILLAVVIMRERSGAPIFARIDDPKKPPA